MFKNARFKFTQVGALILTLAVASAPLSAQPIADTKRDDIALARSLSRAFQNVAKKVEPSVVNITQFNRVVRTNFFGMPLDNGAGRLTETGLGSGVIVSKDGFILTNNHVAGRAEALRVKLQDGSEYEGKLIGRDELTDLAVIKIEAPDLQAAEFASSDELEVGEWVVAIGSPFGFNSTVTSGIVSAKGRSLSPKESNKYEDFIQTDAAINPGNSGGPLLNLDGRIVGINTAIATHTGSYEGIGFAIPSDMAKSVLENIIRNKRMIRGGLGVSLTDAPPPAKGRISPGVLVSQVVEGSPADKAGLKDNDVIVGFDGRRLNEARLRTAIALTAPGTKVSLDVLRDGKPEKLSATVGDQNSINGGVRIEALGISVRNFTAQMARQKGYRQAFSGVQIVDVDPDGRGGGADLHPDDIIVEVRRPPGSPRAQSISSAESFAKIAGDTDFKQGLRLNVIRGVRQGYVDIGD